MPFFPPIMVDGALVEFGHLEPFQFSMVTEKRPQGVVVDARFSNHCFSDTYDPARHSRATIIMDRGRKRAFDQGRYDDSFRLRDIVESLKDMSVLQTRHENFVKIVREGHPVREYRVFFVAEYGSKNGDADVSLFIQSAYSPDGRKEPSQAKNMQKVRFSRIIDRILLGEDLRFRPKR